MSDREGWSSFEDQPEDPDAAFIDALLGPRPEPREMTPEQSERLDRRFYAMVEEQRRAYARKRRRRVIAGAAVAAVAVAAGAGLVIAWQPPGLTWGASALMMKARVPASAAPSASATHSAGSVNGAKVPRR